MEREISKEELTAEAAALVERWVCEAGTDLASVFPGLVVTSRSHTFSAEVIKGGCSNRIIRVTILACTDDEVGKDEADVFEESSQTEGTSVSVAVRFFGAHDTPETYRRTSSAPRLEFLRTAECLTITEHLHDSECPTDFGLNTGSPRESSLGERLEDLRLIPVREEASDDVFVDRQREAAVTKLLRLHGLGKRVFLRIGKYAQIEEWLEGRAFDLGDFSKPLFLMKVAQALANLHSMKVTPIRMCDTYNSDTDDDGNGQKLSAETLKERGWIERIGEFDFEGRIHKFLSLPKVRKDLKDRILRALERCQSSLRPSWLPLSLCHNDLLCGNVLLRRDVGERTPEAVPTLPQLTALASIRTGSRTNSGTSAGTSAGPSSDFPSNISECNTAVSTTSATETDTGEAAEAEGAGLRLFESALSVGVEFIDYEYSALNDPAYDIANHWLEWAGFRADYRLLPDRRQRRAFLNFYLTRRLRLQPTLLADHFSRSNRNSLSEKDGALSDHAFSDRALSAFLSAGEETFALAEKEAELAWLRGGFVKLPAALSARGGEDGPVPAPVKMRNGNEGGSMVMETEGNEVFEQMMKSVESYEVLSHVFWAAWSAAQAACVPDQKADQEVDLEAPEPQPKGQGGPAVAEPKLGKQVEAAKQVEATSTDVYEPVEYCLKRLAEAEKASLAHSAQE